MKARDIVGRRVVAVRQSRVSDKGHYPVQNINSILFDNGVVLYFTVAELDGDYAVEAHTIRTKRKKGAEPT
jgi:hypothetical protein